MIRTNRPVIGFMPITIGSYQPVLLRFTTPGNWDEWANTIESYLQNDDNYKNFLRHQYCDVQHLQRWLRVQYTPGVGISDYNISPHVGLVLRAEELPEIFHNNIRQNIEFTQPLLLRPIVRPPMLNIQQGRS